ncbi:MAG: hypothetical protein IK141_05545 [Clostridia bacterium]|nr:hypothetical protein [Clostridia bacterium]
MLQAMLSARKITTRLPFAALSAGLISRARFGCDSSYSFYSYARRGRMAVR